MSDSSDSSSFDKSVLVGKTLHNKYIIIYKIGRGAFSTVWLCMDIRSKQYYAIKILYPDSYDVGLFETDILNKIKKTKCQYFNHIIDNFVHEMDNEQYCCMVFELLAGSVYDIMKYGKYKTGLNIDVVKSIVKQLLLAMDVLTNKYNMLHTDIKPENILVTGLTHKMNEIIAVCNKNKQFRKKPNKKLVEELQDKFNEIADKYKSYSDDDEESNKDDKDEECNEIKDIMELTPDITVKLSDFGNCLNLEKKSYHIQTRYYRAPEIILECEFSDKCDIWSVGCLIYELLTGTTLFNPQKERRFSTNRSHLYEMINLLGEIPSDLINSSDKKIEFFRKNMSLKGPVKEQNYVPLESRLDGILMDDNLNSTVDLIKLLLKYKPTDRPNIQQILNHNWFSSNSTTTGN